MKGKFSMSHTISFCPLIAPSGQFTMEVTGHATSATITWGVPVGYETIARYGGLRYTVTVENMATGRQETLTSSDTTISHSLVHSTEYCFSVRAEVSGGVGEYSERECYTTPGMTVASLVLVERFLWMIEHTNRSLDNSMQRKGYQVTCWCAR